MITRVNYANSSLKPMLYKKNQVKNFQPTFRGILDNPQTKRVTDGKGNTYIVEPGGHIVIHGEQSTSKTKAVGTAAATGAGTSLAAGKISDMKNSKTDLEENHNHHEIDDVHKINADTDKNQIDEDDDNINETDDINNTDVTTVDENEDDNDDDDDDEFFEHLFLY